MSRHLLPLPDSYDRTTRAVIGHAAAQLDAQLDGLAERIQGVSVDELEWQIQPGVNTVGMLLAHLAVAEAYWMGVVCEGIASDDEADAVVQQVVGLRMAEDGIPLPPEGRHPAWLAGWSAADYLERLERARTATRGALESWDDAGLAATWILHGRELSRAWVLFHLAEHFAHHTGQIALLSSLRWRLEG
jgi:uncharacterized damage-inducible protein DinB